MPSLDQSDGYVFRKLLEAPVVVWYATSADKCYLHYMNKLFYYCLFEKTTLTANKGCCFMSDNKVNLNETLFDKLSIEIHQPRIIIFFIEILIRKIQRIMLQFFILFF